MTILEEMSRLGHALGAGTQADGEMYVFAGGKPGQPLSNMALLMLLRRMKRGDLTVHGFPRADVH